MAKLASKTAAATGMSTACGPMNKTSTADDTWSGTVDEKQLRRPGGLLMAALVRCAAERGHSITQMAKALGYSYPYVNLLMSGLRRVDQVSDDFAQACAVYLRLPRLAVLMMSGRLKADDFFEAQVYKAKTVESAMRFIEDDPVWAPLITAELRTARAETQYCLVKMYESATGKRLLAGELDVTAFATQLKDMRSHIARERRTFQAKTEHEVS